MARGRWVLRSATRAHAQWREAPRGATLLLAVNVSPSQLNHGRRSGCIVIGSVMNFTSAILSSRPVASETKMIVMSADDDRFVRRNAQGRRQDA